MRVSLSALALFLLSFTVASQELSREQKIQQIQRLNDQIRNLEDEILLPSASDIKQAKTEGVEVFRIMPREVYDHKLTIQGGGAYYSFTSTSHDYQKIAQLGLEQSYFSVGFAGANYGLMSDLINLPLSAVSNNSPEVTALLAYRIPIMLRDVRVEQRRARDLLENGIQFKDRWKAVVGHTYVLRAISFDRADIAVAFHVTRKDVDGSLIIFWKSLRVFQPPTLQRENIDN